MWGGDEFQSRLAGYIIDEWFEFDCKPLPEVSKALATVRLKYLSGRRALEDRRSYQLACMEFLDDTVTEDIALGHVNREIGWALMEINTETYEPQSMSGFRALKIGNKRVELFVKSAVRRVDEIAEMAKGKNDFAPRPVFIEEEPTETHLGRLRRINSNFMALLNWQPPQQDVKGQKMLFE